MRRDLDARQNREGATGSFGGCENAVVVVEGLVVGNRQEIDARLPGSRCNFSGVVTFAVYVQIDLVPAVADSTARGELLQKLKSGVIECWTPFSNHGIPFPLL